MAEPKKSFFQRHPGFDLYSLFWFLLFLILAALGRFFLPLWIPAAVVLVYLLIRLLSKNQEKRQVENARFLALSRSAFRWFRRKKQMQTDTQYYYFRCPTCGQSMRLPSRVPFLLVFPKIMGCPPASAAGCRTRGSVPPLRGTRCRSGCSGPSARRAGPAASGFPSPGPPCCLQGQRR